MKNAITFLLLLTGLISFSQEKAYYDSTTNALGENYHLYVGQTLIIKPLSPEVSGYSSFYNGYKPAPHPKYSYFGDRYGLTPKDSLSMRKFKVIEASMKDKYAPVCLILLSSNNDTLTYYTTEYADDWSLPFVTEGFLKKQTERLKNSCMVIKSYLIKDSTLINVEVPYWYCTSVGLSDDVGGVVLKLENVSKNKIEVSYDALFTFGKGFYYCDEYNRHIKKHGARFADNLIYSQVQIGMKRSLCAIILGEPKTSNSAYAGSQSAEVWTIGNRAYYFTNNRLSSIH